MFTRLLLPFLVTTLLAAQAPAAHPTSRTSRRATAKKPKSKGPAQLAAEFTPKVKAALAARWADALNPHLNEFDAGYLKVTFKLDAEGKVADFAVTANSSDEPFAKFCEQFVRETPFEKPPSGALKEGLLEIPFTFTIL